VLQASATDFLAYFSVSEGAKKGRAKYARPCSQIHKVVNLLRQRRFKLRQSRWRYGFCVQIAEDDAVFVL
jgi:hypothetical protein